MDNHSKLNTEEVKRLPMENKEYTREISERAKYFSKIYSKYGFQIVPASKVYNQCEDVLEFQKIGFTTLKPGLWGKSIDSDITHLIKFLALKGTAYVLKWGVSLSYVPHKWEKEIKWHKSLKSSQFDLWCVSLDYYPCCGKDWLKGEQYLVYAGNGEIFFKESINLMWNKLEKKVLDWYKTANSISGIIRLSEEQIYNESKWVRHSPDPMVILAFSIGKEGRINQAKQVLNEYINNSFEMAGSQKNLIDALDQITMKR
jgi:hypothetical protein